MDTHPQWYDDPCQHLDAGLGLLLTASANTVFPDSLLSHLISEDLDLAVGSVHGLCLFSIQILIGIRDNVKGKSLYALLGGELGAKAVDPEDQLDEINSSRNESTDS